MAQYQPINLHKKNSQILVIHCSDPRFQAAYRDVIDDLGQFYDLLVLPGASKALIDYPNVIKYIKLLIDLHGCKTIHIFDHIQCGAFGEIEDELTAHSQMLEAAQKALKQVIPDITVLAHLLGERAEIKI